MGGVGLIVILFDLWVVDSCVWLIVVMWIEYVVFEMSCLIKLIFVGCDVKFGDIEIYIVVFG